MTEQWDADALPFGFIGFGIATVLLALFQAQILDINGLAVILSMGFFGGGLAPLIAGIWSLIKGKTFSATVLGTLGIFWLSYVFIYFLPCLGLAPSISEPALIQWVQVPFFFLWGIYTFWLFLSSLRSSRVFQIFLFLLALFFWISALGHWFYWESWAQHGIPDPSVNIVAGLVGIVCGFIAIYVAMAKTMNSVYGSDVMPLGQRKHTD